MTLGLAFARSICSSSRSTMACKASVVAVSRRAVRQGFKPAYILGLQSDDFGYRIVPALRA